MLRFLIKTTKRKDIDKSLDIGNRVLAMHIDSFDDSYYVGSYIFFFNKYENEETILAGSTIVTHKRGYARRIIISATEELAKYSLENMINIHHKTEFLSVESHNKLAPIYAGLGYTLIKDDWEKNLERTYRK